MICDETYNLTLKFQEMYCLVIYPIDPIFRESSFRLLENVYEIGMLNLSLLLERMNNMTI